MVLMGHLQFRLATAPLTFTKVMVVAAGLRQEGILVHPYLDDGLIQAKSREESKRITVRVIVFLQSLGWVVNLVGRLPQLGSPRSRGVDTQ